MSSSVNHRPLHTESEVPPFDAAAMLSLAADLGDDVTEMLAVFQRETAERLRRMAQPATAPAALLREAHGLKGAAATACAPALSQRAAALEQRLRSGGVLENADLRRLNEAFTAFREAVAASGITREFRPLP